MFCKNCGFQMSDDSIFCPRCGKKVNEQPSSEYDFTPTPPNCVPNDSFGGATGTLCQIFSSPLFLVGCIIASAALLFNIIFSFSFFSAVIPALVVISIWMLFTAAKSGGNFKTPLKIAYGCATAQWILNWIFVGVIVLASMLCFVLFDDVADTIINYIIKYSLNDDIDKKLLDVVLNVGGVIIATTLLVAAAIIIVFNIFFYANLRKLTKSFITSENNGTVCLEKVNTVSTWLLVIGILCCLSIVGILSGALYIITYIWLKNLRVYEQQ